MDWHAEKARNARKNWLAKPVHSFAAFIVLLGYAAASYYLFVLRFFPEEGRLYLTIARNPCIIASFILLFFWCVGLDYFCYRIKPHTMSIDRCPSRIPYILTNYRRVYGEDHFYKAHRALYCGFLILFGMGILIVGARGRM